MEQICFEIQSCIRISILETSYIFDELITPSDPKVCETCKPATGISSSMILHQECIFLDKRNHLGELGEKHAPKYLQKTYTWKNNLEHSIISFLNYEFLIESMNFDKIPTAHDRLRAITP